MPQRFRGGPQRRLGPFLLALLAEVLMLLVVIALGARGARQEGKDVPLVSFDARPEGDNKPRAAPEKPRPQEQRTQQMRQAAVQPPLSVAHPAPTVPTPKLVQMIQLSKAQMASADIALKPSSQPSRPMMGPVDTEASNDTPRVGTGPNGQPLYAASWYREPYDDELSGYLSTASGPGWGMIACRTAPEYRVEDCVGVDEYPEGSNIMRSILAAAWQFRVRPPRIGGRSMVGDWVRIRIDYDLRRQER